MSLMKNFKVSLRERTQVACLDIKRQVVMDGGWSDRCEKLLTHHLKLAIDEERTANQRRQIRQRLIEWYEDNPDKIVTQQELALLIGAERESVARILTRLRAEGYSMPTKRWRGLKAGGGRV